jgi:hypothetical protein
MQLRADKMDLESHGYVFIRIYKTGFAAPMLSIGDQDGNLIETEDWRNLTIETLVPPDATEIAFGVALAGQGRLLANRASMEPIE